MPFYRKKPVVIEARKYSGDNADEIIHWAGAKLVDVDLDSPLEIHTKSLFKLVIETLEGEHEVSLGDYVIKGVAGEFYPCKPDIFALTYEEEPWPECDFGTMEEIQHEMIGRTVAQQEAKRKAYGILKKNNLPIPPELEEEIGGQDADRS